MSSLWKFESWARVLFILFGILAALGPLIDVVRSFMARDRIKKPTQYEPLPEIMIPPNNYLMLCISIGLLLIVGLELLRFRWAAPAGLALISILWIYYIPDIWEEAIELRWFATNLVSLETASWKRYTYQAVAMMSAACLTYLRSREKSKNFS